MKKADSITGLRERDSHYSYDLRKSSASDKTVIFVSLLTHYNIILYFYNNSQIYTIQESFGVIADEATTMRDPFFYRWHAWVDDTFQRHKESAYVRPYTRSEVNIHNFIIRN